METQQQPIQTLQTGQQQPLQKGPVAPHPLIESRVIPSIQEHMEAISDQAVHSRVFTLDDFSDEIKPILSDDKQLQALTMRLKDLHFDASIVRQADGRPALRVAWPEEGHAQEDWWEEEEPWELGEGQQHPQPAESKQAEQATPVPQSLFQATRATGQPFTTGGQQQTTLGQAAGQMLPQQLSAQQKQVEQMQPSPGQQAGVTLSSAGQGAGRAGGTGAGAAGAGQGGFLGAAASGALGAGAGGVLPPQVFQGFGRGGGRGGFRGRGRRGGFSGGAGAGAAGGQGGATAGGFGAFGGRQGIQGPFGKFVGYFFAGFPAPASTPRTFDEFLKNIPSMVMVLDNWVKSRLVLIGDLQPLDKALQRMNRHRIISVPVLDESTRQIRGILDVADIIHYLSDLIEQPLNQALNLRWDFSVKDCGSLLENVARKPMIYSNQASLWEVLNTLSKGLDRVLVVDKPTEAHELTQEEPDVVGMIVQMDFIRFLSQNNAWLRMHPKFNVPLNQALDLNNLTETVVTITPNELTYLAFRKMNENRVKGLAVVDDQGRVIANLSASNIRGISRRNFQVLRFPVGEFLRRDRRVGWWQTPIYVSANDPFGLVFFQFAATGLHRLYILDNNNRPTHVLVPTDMLKTLANM
jgi:CBS-domain-containing membrane protein